jgi:hypothetical protein
MSNGMKMLGLVAAVLVLGAMFSVVYGFGWMGIGHHGMSHSSDRLNSEDAEYCHDNGSECGMMGGNHMMYFDNQDISDEDLARIDAIIENAHMQIDEILSSYGIEEMPSVSPSGGSCH